jgi:hypothetical protein
VNYNRIISALYTPEISRYARDGVSHSYPVIGLHNGKIVDCFFLYCVSLSDAEYVEGPLSVLIIDSEEKTLIDYQDVKPRKLNNSIECDDDVFWKADENFEELYPQVRSFAFSKNMSPSQIKVLNSFIKTFELLVNDSFLAVYKELFSDFFDWVESTNVG